MIYLLIGLVTIAEAILLLCISIVLIIENFVKEKFPISGFPYSTLLLSVKGMILKQFSL